MSSITLFDAAQSVREALATVDAETGELTDEYTTSRELFERKGAACVAYAVEEAAAIEAAEKMLKTMNEKVATRKARLARFHSYLADCMKATGITKLTADQLVTATLYPERDESVEIDDGAEFPMSLCNDPKPPTPSKAKIKSAILAGEPISGARIVRRDRLTIK
jgi:hypothetical protein